MLVAIEVMTAVILEGLFVQIEIGKLKICLGLKHIVLAEQLAKGLDKSEVVFLAVKVVDRVGLGDEVLQLRNGRIAPLDQGLVGR